jgi:hypothetical protein
MAALIKGWLDDSRRGTIWAVGGYIGGEHRWELFDAHWPMALANHGVPYFHMKEMRDPKGASSGNGVRPKSIRKNWPIFLAVCRKSSVKAA